MTRIIQTVKISKKNRQLQQQELKQYKVLCLDHPSDDDLSKFYYMESQSVKETWYKLVASDFGAVSCSCLDQSRNPYKSCEHMRILDKIIDRSQNEIQIITKIPLFILHIL